MVSIKRKVFAIICIGIAMSLMGLNLVGVFKDLRSSLVKSSTSKVILSYEQAVANLDLLHVDYSGEYVEQVNSIFNKSILHSAWNDFSEKDVIKYYVSVPVWENYVLYAFNVVLGREADVYEFTNYKRVLDRGIGQCGQSSMALVDYLSKKGMSTGIVELTGHVVATVKVGGEWRIVDPDFGVYLPYSLEWLEVNPEVVDAYYNNYPEYEMRQYFVSNDDNYVTHGGAEARYPIGAYVEQVSYILIWLIPAGLLLAAFHSLRCLRLR